MFSLLICFLVSSATVVRSSSDSSNNDLVNADVSGVGAGLSLVSESASPSSPSNFFVRSASLNIDGTVIHGIGARAIQAGGETIVFHLGGPATFRLPDDKDEVKSLLRQNIVAAVREQPSPSSSSSSQTQFNNSEDHGWNSQLDAIFGPECTYTVSRNKKVLTIKLGPAPLYDIHVPETVSVLPPEDFVRTSLATSIPTRPPSSDDELSVVPTLLPSSSWLQPETFTILPAYHLSFMLDTDFLEEYLGHSIPHASQPFRITLDHPSLVSDLFIVRSGDCRETVDSQIDIEDDGKSAVVVMPLGGENFGVCYKTTDGQIFLANGRFSVLGPTSYSVDGAGINSTLYLEDITEGLTIRFTGWRLSEDDTVALAPQNATGNACSLLSLDNFDQVQLTLQSSSRASVQFHFNPRTITGYYDVCYLVSNSQNFFRVGKDSIQLRTEQASTELPTETIVVDRPITLGRRKHPIFSLSLIENGLLKLDSEGHLNTTHFSWRDGSVSGYGLISITESGSITAFAPSIPFVLHNYGSLSIDVSSLDFTGAGAIYNHGKMTIHLSNDEAVSFSPSNLSFPGEVSRTRVVNLEGGTLTVVAQRHGALESRQLNMNVKMENQGELIASYSTKINFQNLESERNSRFLIEENAEVNVHGAAIDHGEIMTESNAVLAFTGLEEEIHVSRTSFSGAPNSSIGFAIRHENKAYIASCDFAGSAYVYFTAAEDSRINLDGYFRFGENTTVLLQQVKFITTGLAHLDVLGYLRWHVPTVELGDHISVTAVFHAVLFGTGGFAGESRLLPQYVPTNSTFHLPKNATLVLLDNSEDAYEHSPQLCSKYLVVPIHVQLEGEVMVWGCVMFPFGGTHSGVTFGATAEKIEATMKYDFCKNALSGSPAETSPEDLRYALCVPLFPTRLRRTSGVITRGQHVVTDGGMTPPATNNGRPSMEVDFLRIEEGSYSAFTHVRMLIDSGIIVDKRAIMRLAKGGYFSGTLLTVNGVLEVNGSHPFNVHSNVEMGREASLALVPVMHHAPQCSFPLHIDGSITFDPDSQLRCNMTYINSSAFGHGVGILYAEWIFGRPNDDLCRAVAPLPLPSSIDDGDGKKAELALAWTDKSVGVISNGPRPSQRQQLLYTGLTVSIGLILTCFFIFGVGPQDFVTELLQRPVPEFYLSWAEFSVFSYNYIAAFTIFVEVAALSAIAFHPEQDLPDWTSYLSHLAGFLYGYNTSTPSTQFFVSINIVAIFIWALAWIPLSNPRLRASFEERENSIQRYLVQLFFQYHHAMAFMSLTLFVPVLSSLLDVHFCNGLLTDLPQCRGVLGFHKATATIAIAFFVFLTPLSVVFGHPPYMRDLDIRYKRTYTYMKTPLLLVIISCWKIYGHQLGFLTGVNALATLLVLGLELLAVPCAYVNIDVLKASLMLFPVTATLSAAGYTFRRWGALACNSADSWPVVVLLIGWVFCTIAVCYRLYIFSKNYHLCAGMNNPTSHQMFTELQKLSCDIDKYRQSAYNSSSLAQRQQLMHQISSCRLEYWRKLADYRASKEPNLLSYYFGEKKGAEKIAGLGPGSLASEDPSVLVQKPSRHSIRSMRANPVQTFRNGQLTVEEMTTYKKGPDLGEGTYGKVHMGILSGNAHPGKLVAVKLVPLSKAHRAEYLSQIKKEVDVLRRLDHPNIVRYFGCHANKQRISIFMELATNGNLTQLVHKFKGKLTEGLMQIYTAQILQGLKYLHENGIIHRDIKGENILIDGVGTLKLADFGCSKMLADASHRSQQGCASLVGSPYWMAPEVIRSEAYGTKADVWSLGCTVVEMLNGGHAPWHEKFDNVYSAMFYISNSSDLPSNIPSDVSENCKDFLMKCFARDVNQRASVVELLDHPWLQQQRSSRRGSSDADGFHSGSEADINSMQNAHDVTLAMLNRNLSEMMEGESDEGGEFSEGGMDIDRSMGRSTMTASSFFRSTHRASEFGSRTQSHRGSHRRSRNHVSGGATHGFNSRSTSHGNVDGMNCSNAPNSRPTRGRGIISQGITGVKRLLPYILSDKHMTGPSSYPPSTTAFGYSNGSAFPPVDYGGSIDEVELMPSDDLQSRRVSTDYIDTKHTRNNSSNSEQTSNSSISVQSKGDRQQQHEKSNGYSNNNNNNNNNSAHARSCVSLCGSGDYHAAVRGQSPERTQSPSSLEPHTLNSTAHSGEINDQNRIQHLNHGRSPPLGAFGTDGGVVEYSTAGNVIISESIVDDECVQVYQGTVVSTEDV